MFRAFSALACPKVAFAYASQSRSHSSQSWTRKLYPLLESRPRGANSQPVAGLLSTTSSRLTATICPEPQQFSISPDRMALIFWLFLQRNFVHMALAQARLTELLKRKRAVRIAVHFDVYQLRVHRLARGPGDFETDANNRRGVPRPYDGSEVGAGHGVCRR
jgi:hypothetical protein